jgi:hypothetical protein
MTPTTGNTHFKPKPPLTRHLLYLVLAVAALLTVPLTAMQFTSEVSWTASDFIIAGVLLLFFGALFVASQRMFALTRHRVIAGGVVALVLLTVWVELAVGIFH